MPRSLIALAAALACVIALLYLGVSNLDGEAAPMQPSAIVPSPAEAPAPVSGQTLEVGLEGLAPGARTAAGGRGERHSITAGEAPAGPRITFGGRVFDRATQAVIEGATVRLIAGDYELVTQTDVGGLFALEWPEGTSAALAVEHDRYADLRSPRIDLSEPASIALEPSGTLSGVVIMTGTRLPREAAVFLWNYGPSRYRGEPDRETRSDASGRFEFTGLPAGIYAVGCLAEGLPMVYETGVQVARGAERTVLLELAGGCRIAGRVELQGGAEPIAGAEVRIRPTVQGPSAQRLDPRTLELRSRRVTTDSDGRFAVEGLPSGALHVRVVTPWGASLERAAQVAPGVDAPERIVFPAPARLTVHVVDETGAGVPGASVSIGVDREVRRASWPLAASGPSADARDLADTIRTQICGPDGRADLGPVPSKTKLLIVAYPPGPDPQLAGARFAQFPPGGAAHERAVKMRSAAVLTGLVSDPAGTPLAGVLVRPRARLMSAWSDLTPAHTGFDGRFRLPLVPRGPVRIEFELEGYHGAPHSLMVEEENAPIEVVLDPGDAASGFVLDPDGFAVPDARVRASRPDGEGGGDGTKGRSRTVLADEFGRFRFRALDEGSWSLRAYAVGWDHPEGSAPSVLVPGRNVVNLIMQRRPLVPQSSVSGEVVIEGTSEPVPGIRFEQTRGGSLRLIGARFRITGMKPGRSRVVVSAPGFEAFAFASTELAPGGEHRLGRVEMRTLSQVRVNVVDPAGRLLPDAKVWLEPLPAEQGGARRPSAPKRVPKIPLEFRSRRYVSRAVSRYTWKLRVEHPGFARATRKIEVSADVEGLKIKLEPPSPRSRKRPRKR